MVRFITRKLSRCYRTMRMEGARPRRLPAVAFTGRESQSITAKRLLANINNLKGSVIAEKCARALKARTILIALYALATVPPLSLCLSHTRCSKGFPRALSTCNRVMVLYMYSIWATGESHPTDEQLSVTRPSPRRWLLTGVPARPCSFSLSACKI